MTTRVPTTLKQFKILARLGRSPSLGLYDDIEQGCEFYFTEEDYISPEELSGTVQAPTRKTRKSRHAVKSEPSPTPGPSTAGPSTSASVSRASAGSSQTASSRKRPRRSVASTVKSYAIPDSDDEDIVVDGEDDTLQRFAKKRKAESNMQQWIKQLTLLFKEEQKKVRTWTELFHVDTLGIAAESRCRLVSVDVACRCPRQKPM